MKTLCAGYSPASGLDCRAKELCKRFLKFKNYPKSKPFTKPVMTLGQKAINKPCEFLVEIGE